MALSHNLHVPTLAASIATILAYLNTIYSVCVREVLFAIVGHCAMGQEERQEEEREVRGGGDRREGEGGRQGRERKQGSKREGDREASERGRETGKSREVRGRETGK